MGLRCSLLGHDFGDTEVEREREERGSEVVVTVREYEECTRCGEKHVVSESTEVTSLSAETEGDRVPEGPVEPAPTADDGTDDYGTADAEIIEDPAGTGPIEDPGEPITDDADTLEDDAEILDDEAEVLEYDADADEESPEVPTGEAAEESPEVPVDETGEPVTDDAEILEDEDTRETDREHGEWPDAEDVGPPVGAGENPTDWPEMDDDADATAEGETEASGPSGVFADFGSEELGEPDPDEDENEAGDLESGTGIASAQSVPAPGTGERRDDDATEFFCPRCEFVAPGDRGSLRAGDICPECRKGYLGEREL